MIEKWININKEVPNENELVLTTDGENFCIKEFYDGVFHHKTCDYSCDNNLLTHWISLPKHPRHPKQVIKTETDPYLKYDVWLEYEVYETYLKQRIWISDGISVEEYNSYKEVPTPSMMQNGRMSRYWYFPSEWNEKNPPLPPNPPYCLECDYRRKKVHGLICDCCDPEIYNYLDETKIRCSDH